MKKRLVALIFLLVANLLLLAHAAIPHHHHLEQICFSSHCNSDCTNHEHHHPFPGQQEGDHDEDCCSVKQIAALPSLPGKQECKCSIADYHFHPQITLAVPLSVPDQSFYLGCWLLGYKPEIPGFYNGTFLSSSPLRAPPIV